MHLLGQSMQSRSQSDETINRVNINSSKLETVVKSPSQSDIRDVGGVLEPDSTINQIELTTRDALCASIDLTINQLGIISVIGNRVLRSPSQDNVQGSKGMLDPHTTIS